MIKDLSGQKFGKLNVLKFNNINCKNRHAVWLCRCDCGSEILVESSRLTSGNTKSCGCLKAELNKSRALKHGHYNERLYKIWFDMKRRCYNNNRKAYKYYGAKGITVCKEWLNSYNNFHNWALSHGYNNNLTLERIDFNGNYCPENCKWIPQSEQTQNSSHNHFITFNNKTLTISQWSKEIGIAPKTIRERLNKGWNIKKVLSSQRYNGYDTSKFAC